MRNNNQEREKPQRRGDTSRTSSQGRKEASGGQAGKKGDPEMDEASHSPKGGKQRRIGEKRKP